MSDSTTVADLPAPVLPDSPPSVPEPVAPTAPSDAFSALTPEARQTVEPFLKPLHEKIANYEKEIESSKSSKEKAVALDRLVQDADFQKYWAARNSRPAAQEPKQDLPFTPEEYQSAYDKSMQGDFSALASLQEKQVKAILARDVAPAMNNLNQKAREIELGVELGNLLQAHPDARDLDKFGFLEPALHYYTDKLGKPMEFAYSRAKEAYDKAIGDFKVKQSKEIQDKRGSITETPGTMTADQGVVYLDTSEQVLRAQINAAVKGDKVQYRVKPRR